MLFDFLVLNLTNITTATILLSIFNLNNRRLYFLLAIDLILHGIPIITIIIIVLFCLKNVLFNYINDLFITRYILIIVYYFIFGILIYGIHNGISSFVFNVLWQNLLVNMIILFFGLKYITLE